MKRCLLVAVCLATVVLFGHVVYSDELALKETRADLAIARYGITGRGVVIAILDRGIEWQNPDFIKPDGKTRIKYMLDMSGQNYCSASNPVPLEYTEAQINSALAGGASIPERDAVGHGTVTAGIAAGNGRAFANGKYKGFAPEADLIIVKLTSEGAPAHGVEPAEMAFTGCQTQALDWLDEKLTLLNEPAVALINSGVLLWGPTDGTSIVSRTIDKYFAHRAGRIYVAPTGDEGGFPTHAGGHYSGAADKIVTFTRSSSAPAQIAIWNSQRAPTDITLSLSDGTIVGPVAPPSVPPFNYQANGDASVTVTQYFPGSEFYPVTSASGDHFTNIFISGHASSTGTITIHPIDASSNGRFDIYADPGVVDCFSNAVLVSGRLTDWSSTHSASSVGAHVLRNTYVDINGITRVLSDVPGSLWVNSAGGPTRDGRKGVTVTAPGQNIFATYASNSYWATFQFNLIQDGGGWYGRQGATSGASPIAVGAAALMLQLNPRLTSKEFKRLLKETAIEDSFTSKTPNLNWGFGKINILGAIDKMCRAVHSENEVCRNFDALEYEERRSAGVRRD